MDPMSFTTSLAAGQILAQQLKTGGVHTPAFGPPKHSTIPGKIPEMKGEMAGGSLPTCPMIYAIIADMAIVGIPNAPPPQWREEAGQQQQFGYRHDVPPLPALVPLSLTELYLKVECQISTAFVTIQGTWVLDCLRSGAICDCLLAVPMDHQGTVAGVEIDLGNGRLYTTIVVPRDEAASYGAKGSPMTNVDDPGTYNPDLFRLRVPQVVSGTRLSLKITWFQAMLFSDGLYAVRVPFILPDYVVPVETELASIVKLTCSINTGTPHPVVVGQFNNTMKETLREDGRVSLVSGGKDTWGDWKNSDFIASYQVWSDKILPNLLVQDPILGESDLRGTFCLSIAPPDPKHVKAFKRAVVFLLDRSGSMYGKPMEDACQALLFGLSSLQPEDSFNIIVFDHAQLTFSSQLVLATAPILGHAREWVTTNCEARGGTDILAPLQAAFQLLRMNLDAVPYIFLITDGAVADERRICRLIQAAVTSRGGKAPRISTFGIGHYCNYYFLKMLAVIGRGMSNAAFVSGRIREQMERMLVAASTPLLTNITLAIMDLPSGCEVYPFPIPDLFCGNPLVVSGRFHGKFPRSIKVVGMLPDQTVWDIEVLSSESPGVPLSKVFAKQQLDLLTAQAWLYDDKHMQEQAVNLSIMSGIPCEYTSMIGFETTREKFSRLLHERMQGKKMNVPKFAVGKLAGIALVGGLAIGFGSVAATAGNALIGDVLGNIVGDFGGIPDSVFCCDFSNCDCSNCDFSFLGDCCGCDCSNCDFSFVGDCFDNCGDGCCDPDGICCALVSCLSDSCDNMGDICACILDCIGSLSN